MPIDVIVTIVIPNMDMDIIKKSEEAEAFSRAGVVFLVVNSLTKAHRK
jgi:hypothetical protein